MNLQEEVVVKRKQGGGVKPFLPVAAQNQVRGPQTVSPHHFKGLLLPKNQVVIMRVKKVQVDGISGPLPGFPESDFPQPAHFP